MKARIISAIIMIVVLLPVLVLGGTIFKVVVATLGGLGLYEMIHIKDKNNDVPVYMKIFAYLAYLFLCLNNASFHTNYYTVSYQLIALVIFLFIVPVIFINDNEKYSFMDAIWLTGITVFVGFAFNLLILIRNYDINYFLYLILITIITDTFALFTGKYVGKHKLCPKISPKKTVEGSIGGTLMGTFVGVAFYLTVINSSISLYYIIPITVLLSLVGQLGDLVFSSIKRYFDQKDFGDLIPGHGGVLDRVDSLIFVVLAFIIIIDLI